MVCFNRSGYELDENNYLTYIRLFNTVYPPDTLFGFSGDINFPNDSRELENNLKQLFSGIAKGKKVTLTVVVSAPEVLARLLPPFVPRKSTVAKNEHIENAQRISILIRERSRAGGLDKIFRQQLQPPIQEKDFLDVLNLVHKETPIEKAYYIPSKKKWLIYSMKEIFEVMQDLVKNSGNILFDVEDGFTYPYVEDMEREFEDDFNEWKANERQGSVLKYRVPM